RGGRGGQRRDDLAHAAGAARIPGMDRRRAAGARAVPPDGLQQLPPHARRGRDRCRAFARRLGHAPPPRLARALLRRSAGRGARQRARRPPRSGLSQAAAGRAPAARGIPVRAEVEPRLAQLPGACEMSANTLIPYIWALTGLVALVAIVFAIWWAYGNGQ